MNANGPMVGGGHCIYIDLCSVYNECYNGPMVGGRHCIILIYAVCTMNANGPMVGDIDLCSVYNEC